MHFEESDHIDKTAFSCRKKDIALNRYGGTQAAAARAGKWLLASARLATHGFIPVVSASVFDCRDPGGVEGVLRDFEFLHGGVAERGFGDALRLAGTHVIEQPFPASLSLSISLVPQLLLAALQHSIQPLLSGLRTCHLRLRCAKDDSLERHAAVGAKFATKGL